MKPKRFHKDAIGHLTVAQYCLMAYAISTKPETQIQIDAIARDLLEIRVQLQQITSAQVV